MRPVCLEMNAFGPYAGHEIIDFRKLKDRKLFLICGPTGAGKTTILDAICYALYGHTSGNIRSGSNMRSEYASPEQITYVKFEFIVGLKRYRVERQPEQEIAKKRGTGLKKESASAVLYALNEDGTDRSVIASKMVNAEVERLLGFKSEQFRQVVLLPQGDFRKLLLSGSGERQAIMQVLFHTERYALFQELVRSRHDEIKQDYSHAQDQIVQYLQIADAADENELARQRQEAQTQLQALERKKKQTLADRDAYQQVIQQARVLAGHWQTLRKSRSDMAQLKQQGHAMDEKRNFIDRLKKARLLAEPCRYADDIQQQGMRAGKTLHEAEQMSQRTGKTLEAETRRHADMESRQDVYRKDTERLLQLQGYIEKVKEFTGIHTAYEQQQHAAGTVDEQLRRVISDKETCKKTIDEAAVTIEKQPHLIIELEKAKANEETVKNRLQQEKAIAVLAENITGTKRKLSCASKKLEQAEQQAHRDIVDFESVQALFLRGQASVLSGSLQNGEPCPVCGSTDHPHPAVVPDDLPQKEDVERRKTIAAKSETKRQQCQVSVKKLEATLAEQQRQYTEHRQQYEEDGTPDDWTRRLQNAVVQRETIRVKVEETAAFVKRIQACRDELAHLEEQEKKVRPKADEARLSLARMTEALHRAEWELPQEYRKADVLQQDIASLQKKLADYDAELKRSREAVTEAQKADVKWKEQIKISAQRVQELRDQYAENMTVLKERALQSGFQTVQECRELQKDIPRLEEEEAQLSLYERSVQQTTGRIQQEQQAIGTVPEPDMAVYDRTMKEKNDVCMQMSEQAAAMQSRYQQIVSALDKIKKLYDVQAGLRERYKTIGAVYDLVSGKTTGVNFERYILGALLDEVLRAANVRLGEMSRCRYQLQRASTWDDKRVRQIGLDIEVFDGYTGYARPANTLSGGETFLASLSLALGLADVVQTYSGGIHLDTIFIDEGFGTLDSETLDFALKALLALHKDGRLVGIISHVPELYERIDTRLVIHKTDRGSTASFELL